VKGVDMYRADLKNMREALQCDLKLHEELDTYLQSIHEQLNTLTPEIKMYPSAIRAKYELDCPEHLIVLVLNNITHELERVYPCLDISTYESMCEDSNTRKVLLFLSHSLTKYEIGYSTLENELDELEKTTPPPMYQAILDRKDDVAFYLQVEDFTNKLEYKRIPEILALIEQMKHDIFDVNGFTLNVYSNPLVRVLSKEYELNLPLVDYIIEKDPKLESYIKSNIISIILCGLDLGSIITHGVRVEHGKVILFFRENI
jgi:hypothetical protein